MTNIALDKKYNKTLVACFAGCIVQAIVNIFVPLLFIRFRTEFGLSLVQISLLISLNFFVQLSVDAISVFFVDKIGYRAAAFTAMLTSFSGLVLMSFLPDLFSNAFVGITICVVLYAIGGGLIEVITSPIVESCPTPNKEAAMSLSHSFYCWGSAGVIALSTLFFHFIGIERWRVAIIIWSILPLLNSIFFLTVPLIKIVSDEEKMPLSTLVSSKKFWLFVIIMICSGASELGITQWASAYAEKALGINKTIGDLFGAMFFAVSAGIVRTLYGKFGDKINLYKALTVSGVLCFISLLLLGITNLSFVGIFALGLSGASIGLMWPGTISIASKYLRRGGTALFAFLALAGDVGCSLGPSIIGFVSEQANENLKTGFLAASFFPIFLSVCYIILMKKVNKNED